MKFSTSYPKMLIQTKALCCADKYGKMVHSLYGCYIHDLPDEILIRIFQYLDPIIDELPTLALVCRKWRRILQTTGSLWRDFHVDPSYYKAYHLSMLCCMFRVYGFHVQRLSWSKSSPVYESVFALTPRLFNLRSLRLPILWTRAVVQMLEPLSQLECVDIHGGFALGDQELELIAEFFPGLREVSLNACWAVTSSGVDNFLTSLDRLETFKVKVNSGLPMNDIRSEWAMQEGSLLVRTISDSAVCRRLRALCLHFVPIEMEELWTVVKALPGLKKLSVSNCEHLHGVRLVSSSLQKFYLFNLWSVHFVSVDTPDLRHITIDPGLESLENLEIFAPKLKRACINGSNVLRTLNLKSEKLAYLELTQCEVLDMRSLTEALSRCPGLLCLRLGCLGDDTLNLDEYIVPSLQELCFLSDFSCESVHIRSPTLRLFHTDADADLITITHIYITANHICRIALIGMPALRTMAIQCVSVDAIELNLCSDDQLQLDSCVIQALGAIGCLRLFDCKVNLLSVSTPLVRTVVLYRCHVTDYALQMALHGCPNMEHLNLEKCHNITQLSIDAPPLKFLNLFGCRDVSSIKLACPELMAVNLGQCSSDVRVFREGEETDMTSLCQDMHVVAPGSNLRWSHDFPPQVYLCG